jgi:xanthine dehydrogenase accessory factor
MIEVLEAAAREAREGRRCALITLTGVNGSTPRRPGSRMLVRADGSALGTVGGGAFEHQCTRVAERVIRSGVAERLAVHLIRDLGMCCGGAMEAFIDPILPSPHLTIYGAGHVGAAVARLAVELDLRLRVVDARPEVIEVAALPPSVELLEEDPRRALRFCADGPLSWHLVVTHDHGLDLELVEHLLGRELGWVGLIGSQTKLARFKLRLRAAGLPEAAIARLRCPVGLEIGAVTPAEIAVSVLAELVRLRRISEADRGG